MTWVGIKVKERSPWRGIFALWLLCGPEEKCGLLMFGGGHREAPREESGGWRDCVFGGWDCGVGHHPSLAG
jgi:hypothetical protein